MYCRSIFEYSRRISFLIPIRQTSPRRHRTGSGIIDARCSCSLFLSATFQPSALNSQAPSLSPLVPPLTPTPSLSPFVTDSSAIRGRGVPQLWLTKHLPHRAPKAPVTPSVFNTYRRTPANHLYNQHLRIPRGWGVPSSKTTSLFSVACPPLLRTTDYTLPATNYRLHTASPRFAFSLRQAENHLSQYERGRYA